MAGGASNVAASPLTTTSGSRQGGGGRGREAETFLFEASMVVLRWSVLDPHPLSSEPMDVKEVGIRHVVRGKSAGTSCIVSPAATVEAGSYRQENVTVTATVEGTSEPDYAAKYPLVQDFRPGCHPRISEGVIADTQHTRMGSLERARAPTFFYLDLGAK